MKTVFTSLLLLISGMLIAQDFGVRAGYNISTILNGDSYQSPNNVNSKTSTQAGYQLGGYISLNGKNGTGYIFELMAMRRGFNNDFAEYRLYYLDFPILLKSKNKRRSAGQFIIGLQPSLFMGGEARPKISGSARNDIKQVNAIYQDELDVGLVMGSIIQLGKQLQLHFRGSVGLINTPNRAQHLSFEISISN